MSTDPGVAPPAWVAGRTWYHLYPLGALGCERTNDDPAAPAARAHRLGALEPWLDHVAGLGAGGVLLGPSPAS